MPAASGEEGSFDRTGRDGGKNSLFHVGLMAFSSPSFRAICKYQVPHKWRVGNLIKNPLFLFDRKRGLLLTISEY
ncbi:hypothetical protein AR543_17615 [Paenibacillus bovis]|uniref:Uncharacterized protein n=1 Tax=Paenibacillus bovis TaxID=1616788 RepID=A0A172ZJ22_9BACL|nr:hypothetical protein AR543_17615 [Paenibacillus bovis]